MPFHQLTQLETDLLNQIGVLADSAGELVERMLIQGVQLDQQWVRTGKICLQLGFMALSRAINQPKGF
jgi:hypothetical protein